MLFRRARRDRVHDASASLSTKSLFTAQGPTLADILSSNALSSFAPTLEKAEIHEAEDVAALSVRELQDLVGIDVPVGQIIKLWRVCNNAAARVISKRENPFSAIRNTILSVGGVDGSLKANFELVYEVTIVAATLCCSITSMLLFDIQPTCSDGTICFGLRMTDLLLMILSFACYFMTVVVGLSQVMCLVTLDSHAFPAFLHRHWFLAIMPLTSWVFGNQFLMTGMVSHTLIRLPADLASLTWVVVAFWAGFAAVGWSIVLLLLKSALSLTWLQLPAAMVGFLLGLG